MTSEQIIRLIHRRAANRDRAERLKHAELRARTLATERRLELARTPLTLATPGSLDRYLHALRTLGASSSRWAVKANSLREQRDRLLMGRL